VDLKADRSDLIRAALVESFPRDQLLPARGKEAVRRFTPRTPGTRHLRVVPRDHLWRGRPLSKLTFARKGQGQGGRNHTGHVVVRHRGGGHKRRIRMVDFNRQKPGKQIVERIEHDPGRSAHIALVRHLESGEYSYILAAENMRAGDSIESYREGMPKEFYSESTGQLDRGLIAAQAAFRGNCMQLGMIPVGTPVYNISLDKKAKGSVCRSAGTHGIIVSRGEDEVQKEMLKYVADQGRAGGVTDLTTLSPEVLARFEKLANFVKVKLSSGEVRMFDREAVATIGVASNSNHKYEQLGKAGRKRWLGFRPTVRGVAMNAVDHPHGGGRGKGKGDKPPVSPWGKPVCSSVVFSTDYADFFIGEIWIPDTTQVEGQSYGSNTKASKPRQASNRQNVSLSCYPVCQTIV
jgi:ribosomal protein L2